MKITISTTSSTIYHSTYFNLKNYLLYFCCAKLTTEHNFINNKSLLL